MDSYLRVWGLRVQGCLDLLALAFKVGDAWGLGNLQ